MIADAKSKGAVPILSSMTPRYKWASGNHTMLTKYPFADWTKQVAAAQNVAFVDHLSFTIKFFEGIGYDAGVALFPPKDKTHTNEAGAVSE